MLCSAAKSGENVVIVVVLVCVCVCVCVEDFIFILIFNNFYFSIDLFLCPVTYDGYMRAM